MAETCPRKELLGAYLDRRLDDAERDRLEAHLGACPECRRETADLAALLAEVAASELAPSPAWMEEARAKLSRRPRTSRTVARRRPAWAWLAAAAAVFLVALAFLLHRGGEAPSPDVVQGPVPAPRPEPPKPAPLAPEEKPAPKPPETPAPPSRPPDPPQPPAPPPPEPPRKSEERKVVKEPEPEKPRETVPERKTVHVRATLFAASGVASTRLEGEAAWKALKAGESREFKGVLQVKTNGSRAKTRLGADTVYLSRSTDLALSPEEGTTRLRLASGEAFFSVDPAARRGEAFLVETPHGTVTVRGTRFLVSVTAKETGVHVERGKVDFAAAGKTVTLTDGEGSVAAARIKWVQELEEVLRIEAEALALKAPLRVVRDPAALGGAALGVPGVPPDDPEATAEIRVRRKQSVPYAVWLRVQFTRPNDAGWTLHLADQSVPLKVPSSPLWQWIRVGAYTLPEGEFRLRFTQKGSAGRVDQVVLASDPEFVPEK